MSERAQVNGRPHFFECTGREVLGFFDQQQRPVAAQLAQSSADMSHVVAAAHLGLDAQLPAQGANEVAPGERGVSQREDFVSFFGQLVCDWDRTAIYGSAPVQTPDKPVLNLGVKEP